MVDSNTDLCNKFLYNQISLLLLLAISLFLSEYIYDKIVDDFGDEADSVVYYTLDIDEFFDKLDELAQE